LPSIIEQPSLALVRQNIVQALIIVNAGLKKELKWWNGLWNGQWNKKYLFRTDIGLCCVDIGFITYS